jgi:hypothetical protein
VVALGGVGEALLAALTGAVGVAAGVVGALNPFEWLLIAMIFTSAGIEVFTDVQTGSLSLDSVFLLGAKNVAALVLVAFMKVDLPSAANVLMFVAFWSLTAPNILSAAEGLGISSFLTVWGVPLLTVAYFLPFVVLFLYFIPYVWSWYSAVGVV